MLATKAQKPLIVPLKSASETEFSKACDSIVNEYIANMIQGNISVEEGVSKLKANGLPAAASKSPVRKRSSSTTASKSNPGAVCLSAALT